MAIIVDSALPWGFPSKTRFSRIGQYTIDEETLLQAIYPTGAVFDTDNSHIKRRYIEQFGTTFIERYFLQPDTGDKRLLKTVMMRVFEKGHTYTLINVDGIGDLVRKYSPEMDEMQRGTNDSHFIADIELQVASDMEEELFYDYGCPLFDVGTVGVGTELSTWFRPIMESGFPINTIRTTLVDAIMAIARNQLSSPVFMEQFLERYLKVDTGSMPQIDVITQLSSGGTVDASVFERFKRPGAAYLSSVALPPLYRTKARKPTVLPESILSQVFSLPMTDWHYEYILPKGSTQTWKPVCTIGHNRYFNEAGAHGVSLFQPQRPMPDMQKVVVHKSWTDEYLHFQYFHKETDTTAAMTFSADLFMEAIISPNIVHL